MKAAHRTKYRKLGLKISYYRKLKGLTQEQFAERVDKNLAFMGAVEAPNIDRAISLDTLFDIAEILEVPAHKFLDFNEDEEIGSNPQALAPKGAFSIRSPDVGHAYFPVGRPY